MLIVWTVLCVCYVMSPVFVVFIVLLSVNCMDSLCVYVLCYVVLCCVVLCPPFCFPCLHCSLMCSVFIVHSL